jgi:hypothetical protein
MDKDRRRFSQDPQAVHDGVEADVGTILELAKKDQAQ